MIVSTMDGLVQEKHDLIRKLEGKYESNAQRLQDLERLSQVAQEIQQKTFSLLQEEQRVIPKEQPKEKTPKQYYRIIRKKYDRYRVLTLEVYKLYKELVEVKKIGRELMEAMQSIKEIKEVDADAQKIIDEVIKY